MAMVFLLSHFTVSFWRCWIQSCAKLAVPIPSTAEGIRSDNILALLPHQFAKVPTHKIERKICGVRTPYISCLRMESLFDHALACVLIVRVYRHIGIARDKGIQDASASLRRNRLRPSRCIRCFNVAPAVERKMDSVSSWIRMIGHVVYPSDG